MKLTCWKGRKKRKQTNRRTDTQTPSPAPALVPTPSTGFDSDWVCVLLHETRPTTTLYLPNGFLAKFKLARICSCISKSSKSVSSCGQYFLFSNKEQSELWITSARVVLWQYFIYVFPCFCTYSKNTRNFHSTIPDFKKIKETTFEMFRVIFKKSSSSSIF